jgi:hypothetical protein
VHVHACMHACVCVYMCVKRERERVFFCLVPAEAEERIEHKQRMAQTGHGRGLECCVSTSCDRYGACKS